MKKRAAAIEQANGVFPIKQISVDSFLNRFHDIFTSIERRAYEIFEHDGRGCGRDLEHWLRAESELFHPLHLVMKESDKSITVRAEVAGFTTKDLEVSIEPRRLAISGKREAKEESTKGAAIYCEQCSDQIFRVLELPAEVDPSEATATLKDGILELEMPKAVSKGTTIAIKSA